MFLVRADSEWRRGRLNLNKRYLSKLVSAHARRLNQIVLDMLEDLVGWLHDCCASGRFASFAASNLTLSLRFSVLLRLVHTSLVTSLRLIIAIVIVIVQASL